MVKIFLKENNGKQVIYDYYPEGDDPFGVISIEVSSGECTMVKKAESAPFGDYYCHACHRIREYWKDGKFREKGMIAWY